MKLASKYLILVIGLFVTITILSCGEKKPPNIIFFFVDDMGWQETSVPFHTERTALNDRYHTPNMERLAADGLKFTQAYACALCSPSRVSLMTGANAARHQVTNWTLRKDKSPDWNHPIIEPPNWNMNGLSPDSSIPNTYFSKTLPQILKEEGYTTIHAGKAHFGAQGTPGENPINLGFDVNIAGHAAGGPGSYHGDKNFSAAFRNGDLIWNVPGLDKYHGQEINLTEAITREAKKEVISAKENGSPFYLYLSHYAIHAPWEEDRRFYQKYLDLGLSEFHARYASMVESMDKSLGDILNLVDSLGVNDNTIILFMSDNGSPKQPPQNLPLRGHKITPYEGGTRVPMIVKWPGVTKGPTTTSHYVMIEDVFPSILEMAGVSTEKFNSTDGISWVPVIKGKVTGKQSRPIFWHFPHTYDQPPSSSVRMGDWKLIYQHTGQNLELFNITKDIGEEIECSGLYPTQTRKLADTLSQFLRSVGAKLPIHKKSKKSIPFPDEVLNNDKIRVACIGNSITQGARTKNPSNESYPAQLQKYLGDKYLVRNFGQGGATMIKKGNINVWSSLKKVKNFNPEIVIIMTGTNETVSKRLKHWQNIGNFKNDYFEFIDSIKYFQANPDIYLCSPPAMVVQTTGLSDERKKNLTIRAPRIKQLRDSIFDISSKEMLPRLDVYRLFENRPELMTKEDGVHPNLEGYKELARFIYNGIK